MPGNTLEMVLTLSTAKFIDAVKTAAAGFTGEVSRMASSAKSESGGVRAALQSVNTGASTLMSTLGQLAAMAGGGFIFQKLAGEAISFDSTLEKSQIGLAAIARTFLDLSGSSDQYGRSMDIAKDIQKQLQIDWEVEVEIKNLEKLRETRTRQVSTRTL